MRQPLFFYKFVSFDRKDILENGLIRFAPIGSFNDPFELEPTVTPYSRQFLEYASKLSEAELRDIKFTKEDIEYSSKREEQVDEYKNKYRKEIGKFGVLSLSSNNNINQLLTVSIPEKEDPRTNILMWSHYANSHQGFVIEFHADLIDDIELKKVKYSNERDYLTFEDINDNSFDNIFYKKSTEWKYEQEYRAILPLDKATKIYNDEYHLFKFNKRKVKSITFGCKTSEENKNIIKEIIKSDVEYSNVTYNHSYLNKEGYFLNFYGEYGRCSNNPEFGIKSIPSQKEIF